MQIKVVERTQEILVQEQEMVRKEAELEATVSFFSSLSICILKWVCNKWQVRRPMEAEKYRLEKLAEANKKRVILEAEAESEAVSKCIFSY